MFVPSWDNLDDFFNDFTTTARITPSGKSAVTITCNFDDPYEMAEIADYNRDTSFPHITAKETDLADIRRGDPVAVVMRDQCGRKKTEQFYALRSCEGDGTGIAKLMLTREG